MHTKGDTAKRGGWILGDQAITSISNFLVSALVARNQTPGEFGRFALVMTALAVGQGVGRAVSGEALLISPTREEPKEHVMGAAGASIMVGIALSFGLILAGSIAGGVVRAFAIALAAGLPFIVLQDTWRYTFLSQGRPALAAANSAVWLAFQLLASGSLIVSSTGTSLRHFAAWIAGGIAAAILGAIQSHAMPNVRAAIYWIRGQSAVLGGLTFESLAALGAGQLVVLSVGWLGGFSALGALRAGQLILAPIQVLQAATLAFAISEGRTRKHQLLGIATVSAWALIIATVTWTIAISAVPASIGARVLGDNWAEGRSLLAPLGLSMVFSSLSMAALVILRVTRAVSSSSISRLLSLAAHPTGAGIGASAGALGAAIGLAIANAATTIVWILLATRASRTQLATSPRNWSRDSR